ncbi:MAG: hypothetical protein IJR87_07270 [Bacteroidaceae bacterium]|nr:hypothetical protein [Bacteroidaceae bacterium]
MKKEDSFEKALRQALQKRNGQQPALSADFARQVKARMEKRQRQLTLGRWAAVAGVAASLALLLVLNPGRGQKASGRGEPLADTKPAAQSVAEVAAVVPDSAVAPSLAAAPQPKGRKAVRRKPKPKEQELPDVPELTPEQLKQMQAELEALEQELLAREQAQENALLEYARELELKEERLLKDEAEIEEKLQKILSKL